MLRTSRESSDSDEEPEHEWPYLVLAWVERPIVDVKVDIPLADVKSELGAVAFETGRLEQIDREIIRSRDLYA